MRNESCPESLEKVTADLSRLANSTDTMPRPGFKEALRLRLRDALAVPARMSPLKYFALLSPALIVLIITILVLQPFFDVQTVYAYDQFTLTPESSDALGVEADSGFILESRDPVVASDIEKLLVVKHVEAKTTPDPSLTKEGRIEFAVEQVDDRTLRIAFEEPLSAEEIVKFGLATTTTWPDGQVATRDYNWAFQVKGDFRVVSTIPGNHTSDVPLDTGIEFVLNYENIDPDAFEEALTFTPPLTGHVESSRRMFVFVPDELQPRTLYTVTLSGDLPLEGTDETLGEDYTFSFETSVDYERGYSFGLGERYHTVTPDDTVALTYYEWGDAEVSADVPTHVKLYRYASFEDYVAALDRAQDLDWRAFITADDLYPTDGAQPALAFDAERAEYDGQPYLIFPESLPEGYYVADVEHRGTRAWALFSSSNLTAYVSRATDKTLFWVNDAASGSAVGGATVEYAGDEEHGTTNSDGLASVHSVETQGNVVTVRSGDDALAIVLQSQFILEDGGTRSWSVRPPGSGASSDYWSYLYTDRPTYQPTDTVKFWGYVETREDGSRPEQVFADVGFDSTTLDVTPNGTFAGEFSLRGANPGYYALNISASFQIMPGGRTEPIASRSISVSEYVKPAYTLSIETDVDAAYEGDTVGFSVHGEFFEGTPVKGLTTRVSGECVDQVVTLDDAGNARGSFSCPQTEGFHGPRNVWLSTRPERAEEGQIESGTSMMMFGPKIYLDTHWTDSKIVDGTGTVSLTVRNTQAVDSWDPEVFGPTTRAGVAVTGTVTEITYTKTEVGQSYDFVRKQVVKNYQYDRVETEIETFTGYSDADGLVSKTFAATNPEANYRVELSARDENGREDKVDVHLWARQEFEYAESNALSFHNDDAGEDQWDFPGYDVDDTVHLSIYQNDRPFETPENGRFLYYQAQRGIRETEISDDSTYAFPFEERDVPNVGVYGVLFEEGGYRQVGQMGWWYGTSGYSVTYDASLAELTVSLTPDQTRYAPGQDVSLSVHVQDKDSDPVEAEVNVNVVDEAYYAIFPETVDPLRAMYRWVDDGVLVTQVTKDSVTTAGLGAEKGGGGERALGRFTFKDNAAFDAVQTDRNGNGTMEFTLPDNVTSWRVTAQALSPDAKMAGHAITNVDASLPFFLNPVMRESYLDDDVPSVLVRAAGTAVGLGDTVEYLVEVPDGSYEKRLTAAAGETVRVELPDLDLGTHNVTIEGKTGAFEDKITRQVKIVPSRLVKPVIASLPLPQGGVGGGGSVISGATDRYTEVTFMDAGAGRYYPELQVLSGWWGDRADESIARTYATQMLNDIFAEQNTLPDFSASDYSGDGVRLLPHADGDFDLTARVALLRETPFNEGDLVWYFQSKLDDRWHALTPRETAMSFAALASLGEPVLAELRRVAPELGDDVDVRLWVALALHGAGDDEGARKIYRELLGDARERDGYVYFATDGVETAAERTALLAVLAGALNEPQRDKIHDYVTNQNPGDTTLALERLLFVKETIPHLIGNETEFSYTLRGERNTVTLARGETLRVTAAPEDLGAFKVAVTRGSLVAVSRYDTPVVDPNAPVDAALGLTRAYSSDAGAATTFKEGDLIKVEIGYTLPSSNCEQDEDEAGDGDSSSYVPCEAYEITDVLPSGLSAITNEGYDWIWNGEGNCFDNPSQIVDQRVTFYARQNADTACDNETLTYYVRVVTPGTYLAEPAYIRSTRDPDMNNHSDAVTITINP